MIIKSLTSSICRINSNENTIISSSSKSVIESPKIKFNNKQSNNIYTKMSGGGSNRYDRICEE